MLNAYILNDYLDSDDRRTVENAVGRAGFTPIYSVPANTSLLDASADVGIVGLPVAHADEATVNARIKAFAGAGIRVICIWLHPEDEPNGCIPEGVGKYGITVDVASPDLMATIMGELDTWEEAGGAQRPAPKTKRNKC